MLSDRQQVSRNAKWAIVQTIISACVLFFLYKYLLNELGASKLGLWSLILASTSLARLGELGFSNATLRFVGQYIGIGKPKDAAEVLETAVISISLPFMVLTIIAIPLIGFVLPWFVPEQHMAEAIVIVPWAMLALWLGVTSSLVQSAIDGYGRMDQRNMVLIATNLLYLGCAVLLAPVLGLKGVAIAQALQAGATLLLMWWLARSHLQSLPWIPWRWRKTRFFEIAGFALTMQAGSIAGMLVEPVTKALISRFGGLEFLAYYEMANQVVNRARGVLLAGFHALLPTYAATNPDNFDVLRELDQRAQIRVISLGVPYLTILATAFPLIAVIWAGSSQDILINCGYLISITWLIATSGIPSYFFAVGTGRGRIAAQNQILMLVLTGAIGFILGKFFNGYGVVIGALIAFLIATEYMKRNVAATFAKSLRPNILIGTGNKLKLISYGFSLAVMGTMLVIHKKNYSLPIYILAFIVSTLMLSVIAFRANSAACAALPK